MGSKFLSQAVQLLTVVLLMIWPYSGTWSQGRVSQERPQPQSLPRRLAPTARLMGTVTAPVPSATVRATNLQTGASFNISTGASGQFSLTLPPGRYRVVVLREGHIVWSRDNISVGVGGGNRLNIALQPAIRKLALRRLTTGRSFLVGNAQEKAGYGLYSYLLLPQPPGANKNMRERFAAVIEAYLTTLSKVRELERNFPPAQLNITYMLITTSPPPGAPDASWVLSHYDFARARFLLRLLPAPAHDGPYVISTLRPLSRASHLPNHYLFQDMSTAPPSMAGMWLQQFQTQAESPDFWKEDTRSQILLRMRTLIANAALALPEVKSSAAELTAMLESHLVWLRSN